MYKNNERNIIDQQSFQINQLTEQLENNKKPVPKQAWLGRLIWNSVLFLVNTSTLIIGGICSNILAMIIGSVMMIVTAAMAIIALKELERADKNDN